MKPRNLVGALVSAAMAVSLFAFSVPLAAQPTTARLAASAAITAPLRVSSVNSHYLTDGTGRAVYLAGSHTWNDMQDMSQTSGAPAAFDFTAYVNFLVAHGQNMTILWHKDLPTFYNWGAGGTWHVSQFPWPRTGPGVATDGLAAFDLSQFDQSYFDRLRARVIQLGQNNIYATVELFDGLGLLNNRGSGDGFPFSAGNNVNGVADGGGAGSMTMSSPNAITNFQDAYVRKVIDTVGDQPNVLWEISEEATSSSTWWQDHMIGLIHAYEAGKPMQHPVGYPALTGGSDSTLYASAADWVAPWAKVSPPSNSGNKAIINDSDHSYFGMWNDSAQTNRNYLWENFTSGSSVIFMDPYEVYWSSGNRNLCAAPVDGVCAAPDSRWDNFRDNLGWSVAYANKMNLVAMTPQGGRSSTGWALANTAATGSEFLVYSPGGGTFTVDLSNTARTLNVEWLNPSSGVTSQAGTVVGGSSSQSFTPPFGGDAVLHVWDAGGGPPPTTTTVPTTTTTTVPATTTTTVPATTTTTVPGSTTVRATTGSAYTDTAGHTWAPSSGFSASSAYSVGHAIAGTPDQPLYQSERYARTFTFTAPVANGSYNVTLKLAELYWSAPGQRVFNVAINGAAVLTNFDILAHAAPFTALDETFPVTVAGGSVTVSFTTVTDNAKVDAISIVPTSGPPPTTTTTVPPTTTTTVPPTTTTAPSTTTTTTVPSTTTTTVPGGSSIRVTTGSTYTDSAGKVWSPSNGFTATSGFGTGHAIAGTADPPLYQTERYANTFSYSTAVTNGSYNVTLKFAELYWSAVGRRVFNVTINGTPVLTNFDILAHTTPFAALDETFPVTVTGGSVTIGFTTSVDNAKIDSLSILPSSG